MYVTGSIYGHVWIRKMSYKFVVYAKRREPIYFSASKFLPLIFIESKNIGKWFSFFTLLEQKTKNIRQLKFWSANNFGHVAKMSLILADIVLTDNVFIRLIFQKKA